MQHSSTTLSNRKENGTEDELAENLPTPVTEEFGHEIPVLDLSADGRIYDHLPVLECDETLSRLISGPNGSCSALNLWRSQYSRSYVVIARSQQAALDWLADLGVLGGHRVPTEDERQELSEYGQVRDAIRLGNAGHPYRLDMCRLIRTYLSDIGCLRAPLTFSHDGWMHVWENNPHNDKAPYRDVILKLGDSFEVEESWSPQGMGHVSDERLQELAERRIWRLIDNHC